MSGSLSHSRMVQRVRYCRWLFLLLFASLAVGVFLRVHYLAPALEKKATQTYSQKHSTLAYRGNIVDRNNVLVAMDTTVYDIFVEPIKWRNHNREWKNNFIRLVADFFDKDEETLHRRLEKAEQGKRIKVASNVPIEVKGKLMSLDKGKYSSVLSVEGLLRRYYPNRELYARIVGYANRGGVGGIENFRKEWLSGQDGLLTYLAAGKLVTRPRAIYAKNGEDVRLSIDGRLQFFAHEALAQACKHHGATLCSAALMDVRTGELLALASSPSYNPHNINPEDDLSGEPAVARGVEFGSTVKPFVIGCSIEEGLVTPDEVFVTSKPLVMGSKRISDQPRISEDLTAAGIIRRSSNVGAVLIAQRLGKESLHTCYQKLKFGSGGVLGMPEEGQGVLRDFSTWRREDFATHAYGYGFSGTLLHLLRAYSVFATDGYLVSPCLICESLPPVADERVFSKQTVRAVRHMMQQVAQAGGTAKRAAIAGYQVAGKTGTAYIHESGQGYNTNKKRALFIGMAPASRPRYLLAVMVEQPTRHGSSGGVVAAPIFQNIMSRTLLFGNTHPDNLAMDERKDNV